MACHVPQLLDRAVYCPYYMYSVDNVMKNSLSTRRDIGLLVSFHNRNSYKMIKIIFLDEMFEKGFTCYINQDKCNAGFSDESSQI